MSYGELAEHTWAADHGYNDTIHWEYCTVSGCTATRNTAAHRIVYLPDAQGHTPVCDTCDYEASEVAHTPGAYFKWDTDNTTKLYCTPLQHIYRCSVCGEMGDGTVGTCVFNTLAAAAIAPTCETPGRTEEYRCDTCGNTLYDEIDKLGHSFAAKPSQSLAAPATCTQKAAYYVQCDRCPAISADKTVEVGDPLPHTYLSKPSQSEASPATCTAKRRMYAQCENCPAISADTTVEVGAPLPHTYLSKPSQSEASPATCTAKRRMYAQCENCPAISADTTVEVGGPLGHDTLRHEAKEPTCEETGWLAYDTCKRSGCNYTTKAEIEPLGHAYTDTVVRPRCERKGYTTHVCSRCGKKYADHFSARLAHWYGAWTGSGGEHSALCSRGCGHERTVACTAWAVTDALTVCPVCGGSEGTPFALIVETKTAGGDLLLHGLPEPFDGALYAFTLAFERGGRLAPFGSEKEISFPVAVEGAFRLVRVADSADIPFAYENGALTFTAEAEGAYLLLPAAG